MKSVKGLDSRFGVQPFVFFTLPSNPPILFPYHPALLQEQNPTDLHSSHIDRCFFKVPQISQIYTDLFEVKINLCKSVKSVGLFYEFFLWDDEISEMKRSQYIQQTIEIDF